MHVASHVCRCYQHSLVSGPGAAALFYRKHESVCSRERRPAGNVHNRNIFDLVESAQYNERAELIKSLGLPEERASRRV